jgi:hypothetical protein
MCEPRRIQLGFEGTIAPARYFSIGFVLTIVKQLLDWFVASWAFGRPWSPLTYAITGEIGGLFSLESADQVFYATMLAVALPFLAVGVVLTVRRLRDAGWPLWLAAFFFVPLPINLLFFIVLSLVPSKPATIQHPLGDVIDTPGDLQLKSPAPNRNAAFMRALGAILIPLPVGAVLVYGSTYFLGDYGWSLFVGLPFVMPMLSMVIYGAGREVTYGECILVGLLWIVAAIVLMIVFAFEGLICILMMLPLALPIAMLGSMLGYFVVRSGVGRKRDLGKVVLVLFALLPTMVGAEHFASPEPLRFICETSVVINAPPEAVWERVVSFSDLDPPDDWLFRSGVAYPIRARIEGTGVGAIRRCEFSTGAFVEPIEVWDEPRLLGFTVTSSPPPMREWNPFYEIHPPHLDGFLIAKHGEFLLTPIPGRKTLLTGRTLYQHGLWPASYWRLWSDPIIHRIHDRVLGHIKRLAESARS